ncbi:GreA/GreB family elongation factor [Pedobacter arcticus]|uniref:GreA/GreB family elongation factor n=1 Tax=Pedobacter arcticus TaxID=752140 RepID=UPI0002E1562A|nr:GreA/GreB family elongation factor [Pedobacter arcticus]
MSRGFVKEDDQEEIPIVPPRADLPNGITNYVTPNGLTELLAEKEKLTNERSKLTNENENELRIAGNYLNAKLNLLSNRIMTAKVIDLAEQPQDKIRFGATVTLKVNDEKKPQTYQIVGVDEADIAKGKISFISPVARILIDKKVGEEAVLKLHNRDRVFKILDIVYFT